VNGLKGAWAVHDARYALMPTKNASDDMWARFYETSADMYERAKSPRWAARDRHSAMVYRSRAQAREEQASGAAHPDLH
jgi:hypothetical protein